jgi:hypothetical protein
MRIVGVPIHIGKIGVVIRKAHVHAVKPPQPRRISVVVITGLVKIIIVVGNIRIPAIGVLLRVGIIIFTILLIILFIIGVCILLIRRTSLRGLICHSTGRLWFFGNFSHLCRSVIPVISHQRSGERTRNRQ